MIESPNATYRIQLQKAFGFRELQEILQYLSDLGISHIYASPIFEARPGSLHGYDVLNPNRVNPELGGATDLEDLLSEVNRLQLSWIQDIVPNHMAYDGRNIMLMDILENGSASQFYHYFDIRWDHPFETFKGKLLAPFLGSFYGESLENGEIQLHYSEAGLAANYYNVRFPLLIDTYPLFFSHNLETFQRKLSPDHPDQVKFLGVLYTLKNLPSALQDRVAQIRFAKKMLWDLYSRNPEIAAFIDANLKAFNGEKGNPESFDLLDRLLSQQLFRFLFWKVATEEVNYRRFFNVNDLISLRVEDEEVFRYTHSLIFELVKQKQIQGLRIDHVDGLFDPTKYLFCLREECPTTFIVVEKILELDEQLPGYWPVQGTTGYDFLGHVNALFCDRKQKKKISSVYSRFTRSSPDYRDLVAEKKRQFIGRHMAGDIDLLAHLVKNISASDRHGIDTTLYGLRRALVELLALFPVYRTYIREDRYSEQDREVIATTLRLAKEKNPALLHELEFLEHFLLLEFKPYLSEEDKERWIRFVMRFQQLTGPLMAKGFEDTTLYVYNRLISLNEVGGNPDRFGISLKEFHRFIAERRKDWPHSLNATSTHDTKRGEDVRARLNVLSELAGEWEVHLNRWSRINAARKTKIKGRPVPDRNDEYFFYQTLIGTFPFDGAVTLEYLERLKSYIVKAVREAKVHTAWLKPDTEYENAYLSFVEDVLSSHNGQQFLESFVVFQKKIAYFGIFNSLSQTLLKLTAPGTPDVYQGSEFWDLSLVDPDNRRAVDYPARKSCLHWLRQAGAEQWKKLLEKPEKDALKMFVLYRALQARKAHRELFGEGSYEPLASRGPKRAAVVGFLRRKDSQCALVVAPRRITSLIQEGQLPLGEKVWEDTRLQLPSGISQNWINVFTGQRMQSHQAVPIARICDEFPVALLLSGTQSWRA